MDQKRPRKRLKEDSHRLYLTQTKNTRREKKNKLRGKKREIVRAFQWGERKKSWGLQLPKEASPTGPEGGGEKNEGS